VLTLPGDLCVAGIDVGSTLTKVVVGGAGVLASVSGRTDIDYVRASARLLGDALHRAQRAPQQLACIIATGYGRRRLPFADRDITEITCHARGVRALFPGARTVIDVGGQDAKGIRLAAGGKVVNFVMNDKCAAGTGRFLEVMAATLGLTVDELGSRSLEAARPAGVSSVCTVFAQQEVLQHLAAGVGAEDVLAGLHAALASRIHRMVRGLGVERDVVLTGGCAHNPGLVRALEQRLGTRVLVPADPLLTGALGAALLAADAVERGEPRGDGATAGRAAIAEAGVPHGEAATRPRVFSATTRPPSATSITAFDLPRHAVLDGPPVAGVDAGSLYTKAVVVDGGRVTVAIVRSEGNYAAVAEDALARALARAGRARAALAALGATGLGAMKLGGVQPLDDVSCLARGATHLFPDASRLLDVGGNGTRAVRLGPGGVVQDFSVSGQCAAGSARILEVIAHLLGLELDALGSLSLRSAAPAAFSAGCAVFAETEAISLLTSGTAPADLLAGLHRSMAEKIVALARPNGAGGAAALAGGGARDAGLVRHLSAALKTVLLPAEPMAVGALGAALLAGRGR
jgi:(R)-2-hydroxyacyl-CoA dehydratese activating ATPase